MEAFNFCDPRKPAATSPAHRILHPRLPSMASAKNPTEGSKVTEMEKKTGVKSHEKEIELQAGGQGAASEADQEAQAMEKLKHYKEVECVYLMRRSNVLLTFVA